VGNEDRSVNPTGGPPPPVSVTGGGPLVDAANVGAPISARPARKTIALTFDDGPDPKWTPQILDILRRHNAHATFFAIGAHIAENPALTRRILAEGNEIGSHTYTHVNMTVTPAWRNRLELDLTQAALAGTAGIRTRLLRMPYSSDNGSVTGRDWEAVRVAAAQGYLIAFADRALDDWARPGVGRIVAHALLESEKGEGAVVLLHDGGGDRSQTVAALEVILSRWDAQGFRVTTLSQAVGLPYSSVKASASDQLVGKTLVFAQQTSEWIVNGLGGSFFLVGILGIGRLVAIVIITPLQLRRVRRLHRSGRRSWEGRGLAPPPVSVIVPAYNEEASIEASIRSLLSTDYGGPIEVLVIDDGSTDRTAEIVQSLNLPAVHLIRKPNGGKASALNMGIDAASADFVVLVDGDTVFQRDTIRHLIAPLADPSVGAVSGYPKVANRKGLLGRWQHIEYVVGCNLERRTFEALGCMYTIPGAIGAFRKEILVELGGMSTDTLAEDSDITVAMVRAGWRVVFEAKAVAWTEVPSSLYQLWKQRYRWCFGILQVMWKHKGSVFDRGRAGWYGRFCTVYLVIFQIVLPLLAPIMDIYLLYSLVFIDPARIGGFWLLFMVIQIMVAGYALRMDGERLTPLWTLPFQQVLYRQLLYLVVFQSLATALLGAGLRWQTIRRTGTFATDEAPDRLVKIGA
jgi:cellulose synthase/poly-beta-1,6-N-acetylglucosamine synthase-like glycosyltransferase/peptidoglycan/xylan/chitin deacetylase (PgdA/CDA1 family)